MEAFLEQTFARLINLTDLSFKRYLYNGFKPGRLTGLVGPRGVGKTTLMLQYIKEHLHEEGRTFYFSADTIYFKQTTLLEFINQLYHHEGYRHFFIDEIHKYKGWNQELKNLYDAFPDIQVVYSGSSMLEIVQGSHDLSRRASLYHLAGMSFREYLNFSRKENHEPIHFENLIKNPKQFNQLGQTETILKSFKDYLERGYYPFVFEEDLNYYQKVLRVVDKIIYEDIPNYFDLKTHNLHLFKKILSYLASIPPGEVNTNNIAKNIGVAHQTIFNYLEILQSVGLINMVYPFEGGNQYLRKPQKIFLHNSTLFFAFQQLMGSPIPQGNLRELYFLQANRDAQQDLFYSKQGDYRTRTSIFEIGGKNKTNKQIAEIKEPAFLVKDDILLATQQSIPLFYFGFLY